MRGLTAEHGLLATMFVISGGMFLQAMAYPRSASLYPQVAAVVVMIGVGAVVTIKGMADSNWLESRDDTDGFSGVTAELLDDSDQSDQDADDRRARLFTLGVGGYVVVGLLVGFLYATPAFVFGYTAWQRLPWHLVAILTGVGFLIAYLFMMALNLRLASGVLAGGL